MGLDSVPEYWATTLKGNVGKLQIALLGGSGPSSVGCLTSVPVSPIRMPDMGQKYLGRAFIRQKKHSSGEEREKKALIRGLPDMAFRKFPTNGAGAGHNSSDTNTAITVPRDEDPQRLFSTHYSRYRPQA